MRFLAFFSAIRAVGSWRALARAYPTPAPLPSSSSFWRNQNGYLGKTGFVRSLTLGSGPDGIYLALPRPLNLLCVPLFIPWNGVAVSFKARASDEVWEFHFGQLETPTLMLSKPLGQQVLQAATARGRN